MNPIPANPIPDIEFTEQCPCLEDWTDGGAICQQCGLKRSKVLLIMDEQETATPIPKKRNCIICNEPLDEWQQSLDAQIWHKDGECSKCIVCHNEVAHARILDCLKKEDPISHSPCLDKKLQDDFNARPVTVTQGHLNMLNRMIQFAHRPINPFHLDEKANLSALLETNLAEVDKNSPASIREMSPEQRYIHLKMMERYCAIISIAVANDKDRMTLAVKEQEERKQKFIKDATKVLSAEETRVLMDKERERKAHQTRLKEDPQLRARDKTIKQMISLGMTEEQAIGILDSKKDNGK